MKNNFIVQAWLVILLAIVFGSGLAGIQLGLSERIEANKLAETLEQIPLLVPEADTGQQEIIETGKVYRALSGDQTVGWVIPCSGQGFADVIEILIGVNADMTQITGLYIIGQKETPGLGNKIVEDVWRNQFQGKDALQPLTVTKVEPGGNEIKAVTGATISSVSVCDIVNKTIADMRDKLAAM